MEQKPVEHLTDLELMMYNSVPIHAGNNALGAIVNNRIQGHPQ